MLADRRWHWMGWTAVAGSLAVLAGLAGWRGSDLPAHLFRVAIVREDGFSVWNNHWFGGHHTLGYSVLVPLIGSVVGAWTILVISAAAAAGLFELVARDALGHRRTLASACFALGTLTNVVVGRVPFALGLAVALFAVLAAQRRWHLVAVAASVATPLASPVAGVFLALAWAAWAWASTGRERMDRLAYALAAASPVVVLALLFPQGGTFPFRWSAMVWTLVVCGLVVALVPVHHRVVRAGAVLYGLAVAVAFVVQSPLGGNVVRLGMFAAAPLLLALVPGRRGVLALAVPALLWWQWSPAVDGIVYAPADVSTTEEFYEPLLGFLESVDAETSRVEVVPTKRHWEAVYVALDFPIARGWERQLDRRYQAELYDEGLTAREYEGWLRDTGVRYVALADAPLDPGGEAEATLLEEGMATLQLVWEDDAWRVWKVVATPDVIDGPAQVVEMTADGLTLDVEREADILVRVRESAYWTAEPAVCIESTDDGWIVLRDAPPGLVELTVDGGALVDLDDPCADPGP